MTVKSNVSRAFVAIVASLLAAGSVGCGEDLAPDNRFEDVPTGIVGTWVGGGDHLLAYHRTEDGETTTSILPDRDVPGLEDQRGTCETTAGFEIHPWREIGPIFGSVDFTTRIAAELESFELELIGNASVSSSPGTLDAADYGTGDNAYVLRIDNEEGGPLEVETSWAVDRTVEAEGESQASAPLDVSTRIYAGVPGGDCREVTDDYEIFDVDEGDESETGEASGSEVVEFDAERIKVVIEARAGVVADITEGGSTASSSLRADFDLEVVGEDFDVEP